MTHIDVFKQFEKHFPQFADSVKTIFPCGKNTVRLRLEFMHEYVFSYNGENDWSFETVDSFMRTRMKGVKK